MFDLNLDQEAQLNVAQHMALRANFHLEQGARNAARLADDAADMAAKFGRGELPATGLSDQTQAELIADRAALRAWSDALSMLLSASPLGADVQKMIADPFGYFRGLKG